MKLYWNAMKIRLVEEDTSKEVLVEYQWGPRWMYSREEIDDIMDRCEYSDEEVYRMIEIVITSYRYEGVI